MAKRYRKVRQKHQRSSDASWKLIQRRFQIKKRFRRFSLIMLVFFSVLVTLGVIYAWHYFTRPFAGAAGTFEADTRWRGTTPINLLWLEVEEIENETTPLTNLLVISLNPTLARLTAISLPLDYKAYLPSHGKYPLKAIYGVGNLLDPKQGIALTAKNVSYLLGIPIGGYFLVEGRGLQRLSELFGDTQNLKDYLLARNLFLLPQVIALGHEYLRTNLSLGELARVVYFAWGVRLDKIETLKLDHKILAGKDNLDKLISPLVKDAILVEERLRIQILNGTLESGLAAFAARLVRNMGGEVIRISNYERQDLTKGFLVLDESGSHTAKQLAYIFGVVDSRPPRSSTEKRADITVILGLENYKKIF